MAKPKQDDTDKKMAEIQAEFPDLYEAAIGCAREQATYDKREPTRRDLLIELQRCLFLSARNASDLGVRLYSAIRLEPQN